MWMFVVEAFEPLLVIPRNVKSRKASVGPVEIECVCLWDYFGGDTCMDVNCWAGTEMNVVAEEYQIRPLSKSEYLRLPLRWSLVRIVGDQPQAALGLIPSCWLVAKKFVHENPGLFSYPYWYLGICNVDTAYNHLISDRSAQRPGVFVIFSPVCMNPDPNDYRPFLLMMLCEAAKRTTKLQDDVIERERYGELWNVYFQILTITRSISGHYELFGNRYNTLYDLVYHLSQTKSELPHKLLYGTLSKVGNIERKISNFHFVKILILSGFFQQLKHPNVVRFFGFSLEAAESNILLIFEMMDKGALDSFCRINYQISVNETVDWLCQIARGMAHLHAQIPVIVHGDLAARNVLVCSHPIDVTRYILKITDFGISKRTRSETFATYDDPNKIPFKWLPPEVLKSREMTPKADVWSYGVLAHELYGIGEPYGMLGPEKVIHALNDGHRFERQPKMPHFVYDVVLQCWRRLPVDRPHFRLVIILLHVDDIFVKVT
ncbi:unnamed protein product [Angiostrongylus costaricensis]|uniref:Protein kinase domain-containing protein n=1 Tax=Angiostrongylus costaricensis TaxID=334426 RepID=A0A158PHU7_ANGCS|nr:unnamed protein product [Angiostrongylus costaricensis]